jgi:hypothetical protein
MACDVYDSIVLQWYNSRWGKTDSSVLMHRISLCQRADAILIAMLYTAKQAIYVSVRRQGHEPGLARGYLVSGV